MFSAKKKRDRNPRRKGRKLPSLESFRPRLSIRVWLTVLFVLVTAVSAVAAYGIVRPILETALSRASDAAIELDVDGDADWVTMRVRDHGVGIEPENLSRVFELFTQAHATLERSDGGLGIGLALVPVMVDADAQVGVDVRGRREIFQLVKPPFVDPSVKES